MKKHTLFFILSLLLAIWFAATSWVWGYLANVIYSFPAAILSAVFFHHGRKNDPSKKKYNIIIIVGMLGITSALISFFIMLL